MKDEDDESSVYWDYFLYSNHVYNQITQMFGDNDAWIYVKTYSGIFNHYFGQNSMNYMAQRQSKN